MSIETQKYSSSYGGVFTGTLTWENILTPLRASNNATSWGVETITAPITIQEMTKQICNVIKYKNQNTMEYKKFTHSINPLLLPDNCNLWEMEIWASPVPGGMSTTRISRSPQSTPLVICSSAFITWKHKKYPIN